MKKNEQQEMAMGNTFYFDFEPDFMIWLQSYMNAFLKTLAIIFTSFGEELVLVVLLGFLYWCYDKEHAKYIGTNLCAGMIWYPSIKNIVCRRRPYMDFEKIECLKAVKPKADLMDVVAQGYSFPSGHATNSTLLFLALANYKKNVKILWILAAALPLLIGFSRIMLGVHYPTDILCGYAIGIVTVFALDKLQRNKKIRPFIHIAIMLTASPGLFYCRTEDFYTSIGISAGFFLSVPFEEKIVKFENTKHPLLVLTRLAGGGLCFLCLNLSMKFLMPSGDGLIFLYLRAVRYLILGFVLLGVYPMAFRYMDPFFLKLLPKKKEEK